MGFTVYTDVALWIETFLDPSPQKIPPDQGLAKKKKKSLPNSWFTIDLVVFYF